MNLAEVRGRVEAFLRELAEEDYRQRAGLKPASEQAAIYERHRDLAAPSLLEDIRGLAAEAEDADQVRARRFLAEFLTRHRLDADVRHLTDAFLTREATAELDVNGESISLRSAEGRIRNEADRRRRAAVEAARAAAVEDLNGLLADILRRAQEGAGRLGFAGYVPMCESLSGVALAPVRERCDAFLGATRDMYADFLRWALKKYLRLGLEDAKRHDLVRLLRAPHLDPLFPPDRMRPAAEETLAKMRIDLRAGGRIAIDDEARPTKSPRAFAAAIDVPERVVLVFRPEGGADDYHSFLHELGHALHFGHTEAALPVEFRRLGDDSVTESFAFLVEGWLHERRWLRRFLEVGNPADFLNLAAFHKLYLVRRYCAKLRYELLLHEQGPIPAMAEAYRELLAEATLVEFPREVYLHDLDPYFYSARYLRAWCFEAQLRERLVEGYDQEWFRNDRAGPFLQDLWRQGQRLPLEDLAASLDLGPLGIDPLVRQLSSQLS
jgi:hypothetical protein